MCVWTSGGGDGYSVFLNGKTVRIEHVVSAQSSVFLGSCQECVDPSRSKLSFQHFPNYWSQISCCSSSKSQNMFFQWNFSSSFARTSIRWQIGLLGSLVSDLHQISAQQRSLWWRIRFLAAWSSFDVWSWWGSISTEKNQRNFSRSSTWWQ